MRWDVFPLPVQFCPQVLHLILCNLAFYEAYLPPREFCMLYLEMKALCTLSFPVGANRRTFCECPLYMR